MATKKMSLHGSKKRSNSSPELQLQVTDIDTFFATSAPAVDNSNRVTSGEASTIFDLQLASNLGDNVKAGNTHSTEEDNTVKSQGCSSKESTSKVADEIQQPSVRPKVRNGRFKTKSKPTHNLTRRRQQNKVGADSIVMTVDGSNSEMSPLSSSDVEEVCIPSKGQVFGRVASILVAHFRHKTQKRQRRGSNSDSDSSISAKDVDMNSPRPRSKSFSGRIMRKLGTKEKGASGTDSPHRELPKAQSHVSRIQSCIGGVFTSKQKSKPPKREVKTQPQRRHTPIINFEEFNPDDYPTDCDDDIQRNIREQEIRDGVDPPPGYQPQLLAEVEMHSQAVVKNAEKPYHDTGKDSKIKDTSSEATCSTSSAATATANQASSHTTANMYDQFGSLTPDGLYIPRTVHTQIDYMHCLVPDQKSIIGSSFYWGKIDRFEADRLLENKPEGTFLLRDSAHDEFVFSVSFRRYCRTLHARIEQWKHNFSFDAHDPGVYSSDTICGLLKHYKDPNFCMFFEPMLTIPLPKPDPPSLQELARATLCSNMTYDGISRLALPRTLKEYSREYHYKQRVRMRRFEVPDMLVAAEPQIGIITKTCISR